MQNTKIYIDRLKKGEKQEIADVLMPAFLTIEEEELSFKDSVSVKGMAYLADDHLIIHLNIETTAYLPCSICNDLVALPICIKESYFTEPIADIKNAVYDYEDIIRETVLLQIPLFAECSFGKCPERENIKKFLEKKESLSKEKEEVYFPFSDL